MDKIKCRCYFNVNITFTRISYISFVNSYASFWNSVWILSLCSVTEMVTENVERAIILQTAKRNHNICHVFKYSNVNRTTWRRMLKDQLLDEANDAKVNLSTYLSLSF